MRIHGGKDYYDISMALGTDDGVHFLRDRTRHVKDAAAPLAAPRYSIKSVNGRTPKRGFDPWHDHRFYWDPDVWAVTVLFAGKAYHGLGPFRSEADANIYRDFIWNRTDLDRRAAAAGIEFSSFDNRFFRGDDRFAADLLQRHEAAIAIAIGRTGDKLSNWKLDETGLGNLGFARVLGPAQAYQELAMWLGNRAAAAPPMVTITDEKVLVKKHGMDKWSFRTMPGKKRGR